MFCLQAQYFGGDLKGLTHQLINGYFDSLAINSIWISPLVDQAKGAWGLWKTQDQNFLPITDIGLLLSLK